MLMCWFPRVATSRIATIFPSTFCRPSRTVRSTFAHGKYRLVSSGLKKAGRNTGPLDAPFSCPRVSAPSAMCAAAKTTTPASARVAFTSFLLRRTDLERLVREKDEMSVRVGNRPARVPHRGGRLTLLELLGGDEGGLVDPLVRKAGTHLSLANAVLSRPL